MRQEWLSLNQKKSRDIQRTSFGYSKEAGWCMKPQSQPSAAANHWLGKTMSWPLSIFPGKDGTDGLGWLNGKRMKSPQQYMLVISEPERVDVLQCVSFEEFKFPLSDCSTSKLWEIGGSNGCFSTPFFSSVLPFSSFISFLFKKRPPQPLGRRMAWRWRE